MIAVMLKEKGQWELVYWVDQKGEEDLWKKAYTSASALLSSERATNAKSQVGLLSEADYEAGRWKAIQLVRLPKSSPASSS